MNHAAKFFRSRLLPLAQRHKDLTVGFLLFLFTLVVVRDLVVGGTVVSKDPATQYYP